MENVNSAYAAMKAPTAPRGILRARGAIDRAIPPLDPVGLRRSAGCGWSGRVQPAIVWPEISWTVLSEGFTPRQGQSSPDDGFTFIEWCR